MSKSTKVAILPHCDFCNDRARYDGKTKLGSWGYMCELHFKLYGVGLGIGHGQRLEVDNHCTHCNTDLSTLTTVYSVYGHLFCNIECAKEFMSPEDLIASGEDVDTESIGLR